jgi:hypothetical protein
MWGALGENITHRTNCDGDKQYTNFHNSLFSFLQLKIIAHSINIELIVVKCVAEIFFDKHIRKDYMSNGATSGRSRGIASCGIEYALKMPQKKGNR